MSYQRLNFDGSYQQSGQGSFLSTGPNDSNGYVLPSYEQYPSRFPAHAGRLPSVDGPVPQNDRGNGSYEGRFSNFGEPAPQDNVSSGSYEPYLVSQNIGFGGSYDQYLSRFPAHANRFPNAVETPPQTNEPRGNGPITWNGSPRPVPATNLTATQSVEVHYGRNYVDPTSLGLGFGDDQISYHFSRFEAGAFTVGPANAQQHHLNAQASHDWHHVQGVQGRRGQHETFQDFHASYAAASSNVQHEHPNVYSSYMAPSNGQYEQQRASSPYFTSAATRYTFQAPVRSFDQLTASAQRVAGLRGAFRHSPNATPNPSQPSNSTLSEPVRDPNPSLSQAQTRAMEQARSLERRRREAVLRRRAARTFRAPSPADILHCTVLSAADPSHDPECPICQDSYDDNEHVAIRLLKTVCNHVFGRKCLQEWVDSGMDNAHRCPNCRQSIAPALDLPLEPSHAPAELHARQQQVLRAMQRRGIGRVDSTPQPLPAIIPATRTSQTSRSREERAAVASQITLSRERERERDRRREARAAQRRV